MATSDHHHPNVTLGTMYLVDLESANMYFFNLFISRYFDLRLMLDPSRIPIPVLSVNFLQTFLQNINISSHLISS